MTKLLQKVFSSKLVFSFYCLIIILLVTLPLNSAKELNDITIFHFRGDYFFHALLFLPWALFQFSETMILGNDSELKSYSRTDPERSRGIYLLLWIIIGLLFAVSSELIQFFLSYRAFNINDMFANTIGVIFGLMIWLVFKKVIINS